MDLLDLLKYIETKNEKYVTIYVAIGSSARCSIHQDNTGMYKIEPKLEQEYPMFIRELKSKYPTYPLYIILIDPSLEDPPFVVCNSQNKVDDTYWKYESDMYHSDETNIHVCPYKISVSYGYYHNYNQDVRIDSFFERLNELSIKHRWFSVLHDFSGKHIANMAKYYDSYLGDHRDHIIYGLGVRKDEPCMIDLTLPICNFSFENDDESIKVFNPFCYDNITELNSVVNTYREASHPDIKIMEEHCNEFMNYIKKEIYDSVQVLRQLRLLIDGKDIIINLQYEPDVDKLIQYKKYRQVFDMILKLLFHKLTMYLQTKCHDPDEMANTIIVQMIDEPNIYRWTNIIQNILV